MSRIKRRSQLSTIRDINMTPLIDLTFLLLIVFMITVPLMEYSIDVSPPEMNANPIPDSKSYYIDIDKNGFLFFNNQEISKSSLEEKINDLLINNKDTAILLRADGTVSYNKVIEVMKIIKNCGIKNISLVTQAESH